MKENQSNLSDLLIRCPLWKGYFDQDKTMKEKREKRHRLSFLLNK